MTIEVFHVPNRGGWIGEVWHKGNGHRMHVTIAYKTRREAEQAATKWAKEFKRAPRLVAVDEE